MTTINLLNFFILLRQKKFLLISNTVSLTFFFTFFPRIFKSFHSIVQVSLSYIVLFTNFTFSPFRLYLIFHTQFFSTFHIHLNFHLTFSFVIFGSLPNFLSFSYIFLNLDIFFTVCSYFLRFQSCLQFSDSSARLLFLLHFSHYFVHPHSYINSHLNVYILCPSLSVLHSFYRILIIHIHTFKTLLYILRYYCTSYNYSCLNFFSSLHFPRFLFLFSVLFLSSSCVSIFLRSPPFISYNSI